MPHIPRRQLLQGLAASTLATVASAPAIAAPPRPRAQIAITLDLEMSR